MLRSVLFAVGVVAALVLLSATGRTQTTATRPTRRLITQAVDLSRMAALAGNTRPEANSANDRGAVAGDFRLDHLQLQLRLPAEKQQELDQLTRDQQDPTSPDYHKWLTPAEFAQRFSLAPEDIAAITTWLKSAGFTVDAVNPQSIVFSGTAGQVHSAFRTEIHHLEVRGERHIANMTDPQIPAALAPAIIGIVSLNDFRPQPATRPRAAYTPGNGAFPVVPADLATIYNLNPAFTAGYTGQGQTIVLLEDSDMYSQSDWFSFRSSLGLAAYAFAFLQTVHPSPATGAYDCFDPGAVPGPETEATIDAEWASAAAPGATIEIASCADSTTNFGGFIALENLLNSSNPPPAVVSLSYGESEVGLGSAFNAYISSLYQQGASEGVSIFASSGDAGAAKRDQNQTTATHGIGISGFASTPYNVAVGGTDFGDTFAGTTSSYWNSTNTSAYGSAISYIPEIPWNASCASALIATNLGYATTYGANGLCNSVASNSPLLTTEAGGGGPSGCATGASTTVGVVGGNCVGYPKPYWQSLAGNPNDGVRDIPDVSLFAATGYWNHYYVACWSDLNYGGKTCSGAPSNWSGFGGTSFAAPIMAGIQALIDQKTGERQGNPAPIYYALAAREYGANGNAACNSTLGNGVASGCIFYDVTQGDTDVICTGTINCYTPSGANGVLSLSSSSYQPAFTATAGWDFATGIGTVNAYNLVKNWPQSGITTSSGTPQTAVISTQFAAPLVAKITDASGNAVSAVTVTFRAPASGASGTFAGGVNTATTDSSGLATSPLFTANGTTGSYTVIASAPDIVGTANFSLTNTLSMPASVSVLSGSQQSTMVSTAFLSPLVAVVKDANGDPMSNITVTFAAPGGTGASATFVGGISTSTTDARGQTSVSIDANGTVGLFTVTASVAGVSTQASFTLSNTLTTPWSASGASGSGQSAAITNTFAAPFTVTVIDTLGHPVSGAFVTFVAPAAGSSGTFPNGSNSDREMTDPTGKATAAPFTANLMAGPSVVDAHAGSNEIANYILTITPGSPAGAMATSGSEQIAAINSDFQQPLIATIRDKGGNTVGAGAKIMFTVFPSPSGAGATAAGQTSWTATTDLFGRVTAYPLLANNIPGSYVVAAIIGPNGNNTLNVAVASFFLTNLGLNLTNAATSTVQVTRGSSATVTLNVGTTPAGITLGQPVRLSCSGTSALSCTANPTTLQVGHSGATATITINAPAASRTVPPQDGPAIPPPFAMWVLASWFAALSLLLRWRMTRPTWRRNWPALLMLVLLVTVATSLVSCSGGSSSSAASPTSKGPGSVTVSASGDGLSDTITIPVNVN